MTPAQPPSGARGNELQDRRIGQVFVQSGAITEEQRQTAVELQRTRRIPLGEILLEERMIDEQTWTAMMMTLYSVPACNFDEWDLALPAIQEAVRLLRRDFCELHRCIALQTSGRTIAVVMVNPDDMDAITAIEFVTGRSVVALVAPPRQIRDAIARAYSAAAVSEIVTDLASETDDAIDAEAAEAPDDDEPEETHGDPAITAADPPVVRLVKQIIARALERGASDIHFETLPDKRFAVRIRVDGILEPLLDPPYRLRHGVFSRLKILARLKLDERRKPQDGRLRWQLASGQRVEFRVSVIPALQSEERAVLRLHRRPERQTIAQDGFELEQLRQFRARLYEPNGIILVTGPTGSGKTTTLYGAIRELADDGSRNILTIEDPIEQEIPGVNQSQVNEAAGYTFADGLRAFLRQDPDVILVGEMRDEETTSIAIRAALTGHLVLSTLHTNDAASAFARLIDLHAPVALLNATVRCIIAQRLVRKVCSHCCSALAGEATLAARLRIVEFGLADEQALAAAALSAGRGCAQCNHTGYHGRTGVYEVLPMTDRIREALTAGASAPEIRLIAVSEGMQTLQQSALRKVLAGETTADEVVRTIAADTVLKL